MDIAPELKGASIFLVGKASLALIFKVAVYFIWTDTDVLALTI